MAIRQKASFFDLTLDHCDGINTGVIRPMRRFCPDAEPSDDDDSDPGEADFMTGFAAQFVFINSGFTVSRIRELAKWLLETANTLIHSAGTKSGQSAHSKGRAGFTAVLRFYATASLQTPADGESEREEFGLSMLSNLRDRLVAAQEQLQTQAVVERPAELVRRCFVLPTTEFHLIEIGEREGRTRLSSGVGCSGKQQLWIERGMALRLVRDAYRAMEVEEVVEREQLTIAAGRSSPHHDSGASQPSPRLEPGCWTLPRPPKPSRYRAFFKELELSKTSASAPSKEAISVPVVACK